MVARPYTQHREQTKRQRQRLGRQQLGRWERRLPKRRLERNRAQQRMEKPAEPGEKPQKNLFYRLAAGDLVFYAIVYLFGEKFA
jgi:hypothetical protein